MIKVLTTLVLMAVVVLGHQFTPTYPKLEHSYVEGILRADMTLFNARKDVSYYEVSVYDAEWNPVSFATMDKVSHVPFNGKKDIEVFVRGSDRKKIVYICSESRIKPGKMNSTFVSSRVCSKVK